MYVPKSAIPSALLVHEGLLKFMHEGMLVFDTRNCIETMNEAALRLLGYASHNELAGKHMREIYAFPDALDNIMTLHSQGENIDNWENTFLKSDGSSFSGAYSLKTINDGSEASVKMMLFRDITAEKKYTATIKEYTSHLEKSNKELDQFAYIVSHDLKAPLRAISNLSVWLEEDLGGSLSDENKNNLTMLRGRVLRMESLINGILEYSRVGRTEVASEDIDTFSLVKEAIELLCPPQHFSIDIMDKMPIVNAPRVMLLQIFTNLIGNAIKYNNKKEGLVKVTALERDDCFEFTVEDNGPGIAKEYYDKIFMIFQTLQSRDKFESTGIGLTIVKRILKARGGKVWVESELDMGSKFFFTWPKTISSESKNSLA